MSAGQWIGVVAAVIWIATLVWLVIQMVMSQRSKP